MAAREAEEKQPAPAGLTSVWNGLRLFARTWLPQGEPRAMMYITHGVGEHMGRYEKLAEFLAENSILVFGHDHVGHGKSEGDRVFVETFDTYIQDVIHHVEDMKREHPDLPCLLMGHSMGGLVALHVARLRPDLFTGHVVSAGSVEVDPDAASGLVQVFARVLAFFLPQVGIKAIDVNFISSIPEEVRMYEEDPLVYHGKLKAKWATAMIESMNIIREEIGSINQPMLVIHGTDDHIVPPSASQFTFDNVSSEDKTFERFEGNRHEVLHDTGQERARELIKDWVLAHLSQPPQRESPPPEPQALERESEPGQEPETTGQEPETTAQESESAVTQEPDPESETPEQASQEDV